MLCPFIAHTSSRSTSVISSSYFGHVPPWIPREWDCCCFQIKTPNTFSSHSLSSQTGSGKSSESCLFGKLVKFAHLLSPAKLSVNSKLQTWMFHSCTFCSKDELTPQRKINGKAEEHLASTSPTVQMFCSQLYCSGAWGQESKSSCGDYFRKLPSWHDFPLVL